MFFWFVYKLIFCNVVLISLLDFVLYIINRIFLVVSKCCILMNVLVEEKFRLWMRVKLMMRKWIGLCCYLVRLRSFWILFLIVVIVLKNIMNWLVLYLIRYRKRIMEILEFYYICLRIDLLDEIFLLFWFFDSWFSSCIVENCLNSLMFWVLYDKEDIG